MSEHIDIAETPEALTPEWVTAALAAGGRLGDATVSDVSLEPLGTGQMSDSLRLRLAYAGKSDGPATLVAKLPAADDTSRTTALTLRSYEREVRFYQELAPTLPIKTPGVFYADIDPATAGFVLLLEDLAPARQGDQLVGCTPEAAVSAVDELVALHAPRWDDATLVSLEWLHRDPEAERNVMMTLLPAMWAAFRERYDAALGLEPVQVGEALFGRLERLLDPPDGAITVVHGDYRLDNLLFDPRDDTVRGVVDWQTCTVGLGAFDVAYFIGAGLVPEDRRREEGGLVRRYHRGLTTAGAPGYSWEQCWETYRLGTFAGLVMAVGASMLVERTARGDEMFMTMARRHSRHALDLDALDLLSG